MQPFEPFEPQPRLAVGVSGGPDSLALALLLHNWTQARGGAVLALTVDHGLRPESGDEARWVGAVLGARGIAHAILPWSGPKPSGAVHQDRARVERYARLRAACAEAGILHLAIAHHRSDRAETVLLRLQAGSGLDGLAGMAWQRELPELRVIRPLLTLDKARLEATLRAAGQDWVRDPSNANPDYLRVRVRRRMPALAAEGLDVGRVNAMAETLGRLRRLGEGAQDALLGRAVALHPAGFARIDLEAVAAAPAEIAQPALARVLMTIGGRVYPPRQARLARLHAMLRDGLNRARTLGGCRLVPWRGICLVVREAGRTEPVAVAAGQTLVYDGRYAVTLRENAPADLCLAPLGRDGWAALTGRDPARKRDPLPPPVRPALPALFDGQGVREVPALGWLRRDAASAPALACFAFAPWQPLTGAGFTVAQ